MRRALPLVFLAVPVGVSVSCYGATQMTVEVQTDLRCAEQLRSALYVGSAGEAIAETGESECTPLGDAVTTSLGDLVLAPGGEQSAAVTFKVKLGVGVDAQGNRVDAKRCEQGAPGCVIASRRFTYAEHDQRRLVVRLYRDCLGKVCGDGLTCVQGGSCVSDLVECQGADCGVAEERPFVAPVVPQPGGPDGSVPVEGGAPEGGAARCVGPNGDDVLLAGVVPPPAYTRASATAVYWISQEGPNAGIKKVSKSPPLGAPAASTVVVDPLPSTLVTSFALEGDFVWYTTTKPTGLLYVPGPSPIVSTTGMSQAITMVYSSAMTGVFVADAAAVFLYRRNQSFGLFSQATAPTAIAVGSTRLFLIDTARTLQSKTFDTNTPVSIRPGATALVSDDVGTFAAADATGTVEIGAVTETAFNLHVAAGVTSVSAMALDTASVYWLGDNKITRAPRSKAAAVVASPVLAGDASTEIQHFSVDSDPNGCLYYWTVNPMAAGAMSQATLRIAPKGP